MTDSPMDPYAATAPDARWREDDSARFRELGDLFVPSRHLQLAILAEHVPGGKGQCEVVDLGCGDGVVCAAVLARWPYASVVGIDASQGMLEAAVARCSRWPGRFTARRARLEELAEPGALGRPRAIVSSLAIHHLHDVGKRRLFAAAASALESGGALVIADVVRVASGASQRLAARQWDEAVRAASAEVGRPEALEIFRREGWNMFALPEPDPEDHPAGLADQLQWLRDAGLVEVDAYWAHAGHAVFGGRAG